MKKKRRKKRSSFANATQETVLSEIHGDIQAKNRLDSVTVPAVAGATAVVKRSERSIVDNDRSSSSSFKADFYDKTMEDKMFGSLESSSSDEHRMSSQLYSN